MIKKLNEWLNDSEKKYDNHHLVAVAGISAGITMLMVALIMISKGIIH